MSALSRTPNSTSPPTPSANKVSVKFEKWKTTSINTKSRRLNLTLRRLPCAKDQAWCLLEIQDHFVSFDS